IPGLPILVLSQHVEQLYARELLSDDAGGVGYLLKDRVFDIGQFIEAIQRVATGGTAMDPAVISQLLARQDQSGPLAQLTPRARAVLADMADGRPNAPIPQRLYGTGKAVSKHIDSSVAPLALRPSSDDGRRVLAVLAYLNGAMC